MTSFAFILGVLPLVLASGAGASARQSIGITVFTGMIASTCLAVLFVPSLFVVIQRFEEWVKDSASLKHYVEAFSDPSSSLLPVQVVFVQASGKEIRIDVSKGVQSNVPLDEVLKYLDVKEA